MNTRDEEKAEDRFRMLDAIIQDRIDVGAKLRIAEQQAEIEALKKERLKHLAEIKWLEDEDADLKKDAERYRLARKFEFLTDQQLLSIDAAMEQDHAN